MINKPTLALWEDGEWLRIESPQLGTRFISKKDAMQLLSWIGKHSKPEKVEFVLK